MPRDLLPSELEGVFVADLRPDDEAPTIERVAYLLAVASFHPSDIVRDTLWDLGCTIAHADGIEPDDVADKAKALIRTMSERYRSAKRRPPPTPPDPAYVC